MLPSSKVPVHLVIIPDGNRRWAKANNKLSFQGHLKGYERANELISEAKHLGIQVVTLWGFSTENWTREKSEVDELLKIIHKALRELHKRCHKDQAKFLHIGRKDRLTSEITTLIATIEEETKNYTEFCLCAAIDYGGEDELRRAGEKLQHSKNKDASIRDFLDTTLLSIPNPDFIIRTSGECRTSGFMPLQSAYSEWYFDTILFPDFDTEAFHKALDSYNLRNRRFGK